MGTIEYIDCCAVCNHTLNKKFPEDYPEEWKFCCGCRMVAEIITEGIIPRSDLFKEIYKKITLVG